MFIDVKQLYEFYLTLNLATISGQASVIYNNQWVVQTGMSICHPHPHRHYTKEEFEDSINNNPDFYDYLTTVINIK